MIEAYMTHLATGRAWQPTYFVRALVLVFTSLRSSWLKFRRQGKWSFTHGEAARKEAQRPRMDDKKSLPRTVIDPSHSLSRQVYMLAFEASMIDPIATCFQGK